MNISDQEILNDFAQRSLRDSADQDYIAARMSYRVGLTEPFLWSALHAIEKYMKAILLFNGHGAKNLSHDIVEALNRVKTIKELGFTLTPRAEKFIKYLNYCGQNRYFEEPASLDGDDLEELDHTIWYVRRYCFMMGEDGRGISRLQNFKANIEEIERNPCDYELWDGGFLEKVIEKNLDAYPYLVWRNVYFGQHCQDKEFIKNKIQHFSGTNPTLAYGLFPFFRASKVLAECVRLSPKTIEYINEAWMREVLSVVKEMFPDEPLSSEPVTDGKKKGFKILFGDNTGCWLLQFKCDQKPPFTVQFSMKLTPQHLDEIKHAKLNVVENKHIMINEPDDIRRIPRVLFEALVYCKNLKGTSKNTENHSFSICKLLKLLRW